MMAREGILIRLVRIYQRHISSRLPRRCRYYPTCSEYALTAWKRHGVYKGSLLAVLRLARCNPWTLGGVDHVPERGKWKAKEWIPPADWVGHDLEGSLRTKR